MSILNKFASSLVAGSFVFMICTVPFSVRAQDTDDQIFQTLRTLEKRLDARIGLAVMDSETGRNWNYRSDERFPMTSTFKALACAAILYRVDQQQENLSRKVVFSNRDLVTYSPVTEKYSGEPGMTIGALCDATMSLSDNTAGNLILDALGGPDGVTTFLRGMGDEITRLDRREPNLNEGIPGDVRDTTTPAAIAQDLHGLVLGSVLSEKSRKQLKDWLVGNQVGGPLIRSGMPETWIIGDRTGAGGYGSRANIGVVWPTGQKPVVVAIYITETTASFDARNAAIAEIGGAIADSVTAK